MTTTKPTMALAELIEKSADSDLLRQMIAGVVEQLVYSTRW
jgi:hypothetical protein